MFAATGCSKQEAGTDGKDCPMTIQPEVVSADGALKSDDGGATKATLINDATGLRSQGFGLSIYNGTTAYKDKVEMEYKNGAWAPKNGTMDWKWPAGTAYTFYAWSPAALNVGTVTSAGVPAFTYSGISDQKDIMLGYYSGTGNNGAAPVKFSHALASVQFKTGTITGLGNITKVELSGVATSGTCTPSYSGSSTVGFAWSSFGGNTTLTQSGLTAASTTSGTAIGKPFLTLPQSAALTVKLTDANSKTITAAISAPALTVGKTAVYTINYDGQTASFTVSIESWSTGQSEAVTVGEEEEIPYVEIEALYDGSTLSTLKWYKENLAITASGNKEYNNTGHINGDYFQWAAYKGYCGDASSADMGLLVYESFTSTMCGDGSSEFVFKSGKGFFSSCSPYYKSSTKAPIDEECPYSKSSTKAPIDEECPYSKYRSSSTLEKMDDVANIVLGDPWRMPTMTEMNALIDATYCAYDATDKGVYVFRPDGTHTAGTYVNSVPAELSKDDALLFFPLVGTGESTFSNLGTFAECWLATGGNAVNDRSSTLKIQPASNIFGCDAFCRYAGFSVRPVAN